MTTSEFSDMEQAERFNSVADGNSPDERGYDKSRL